MINVKVIDFDQSSQAWICETENGKQLSIKDSERFLNEMSVIPMNLIVRCYMNDERASQMLHER
jgi:hypothetical protein